MPDPLTVIGAGSALAGLAGSLFASGTETQELDPEVLAIYQQLLNRSQEGIADDEVNDLINQAKRNVGAEAGAVTANQRRRIALQGGGVGSQNVAANRVNSARLNTIGGVTTEANLADERAKAEALRLLAGFSPNLRRSTRQTGQGFNQLFGAGLNLLFNDLGRPAGSAGQETPTE